MSGAISAATIATIAAAGVAAVGTGFAVKQGLDASGQQQQAMKQQNQAQQTATAASLSTERKSEVAQGAANQLAPNVAGILQRAATVGTGMSSTMLTGAGGVNPSGANLGGNSLLGK